MLLIVLLLGGTDLTLTATGFGKPESDNGEVSELSEAPLPSRDTLAGSILACFHFSLNLRFCCVHYCRSSCWFFGLVASAEFRSE